MSEVVKHPKLTVYNDDDGVTPIIVSFYCPACKYTHPYRIKRTHEGQPLWTWNGSIDKPTFVPSLRVIKGPMAGVKDCHLFLVDGVIDYCSDSHHEMAGQKVDLPDMPSNWRD